KGKTLLPASDPHGSLPRGNNEERQIRQRSPRRLPAPEPALLSAARIPIPVSPPGRHTAAQETRSQAECARQAPTHHGSATADACTPPLLPVHGRKAPALASPKRYARKR